MNESESGSTMTYFPSLSDELKKNKKILFWYGIGLLLVGISALIFPVASTFAVNMFVGMTFMVAGGVSFFGSFSMRGTGPFFGAFFWGLLQIAAGLFVIFNPLAGTLTLTFMVAIIFIIQGVQETFMAFSVDGSSRVWLILSAIVSLVAGFLIAAGLPELSLVTLGIFVGVNFISSGVALLMVHHKL